MRNGSEIGPTVEADEGRGPHARRFGRTGAADLCKLPVHFFPSKTSIISTAPDLETIKDLCITKETKKVFGIQIQKLHFGEIQEIQLFGIQNR